MHQNSRYTILVVDDDELFRQIICELLKIQHYRVLQAADGIEGLDIVRKVRIDLVITDITMPVLSGIELVARIRRQNPVIPIIVSTGNPRIDTAVASMKVGADDYVTKPIHPAQLYETVSNLLKREPANEAPDFDLTQVAGGGVDPFNGYKVISELGEGDLGIVFLAEKRIDGEPRRFALKLLKNLNLSDTEKIKLTDRFLHEAEAAAQVRHPNVVEIFDRSFSKTESCPFIVMELLYGKPLNEFLDENDAITILQKTSLIRQIADALAAIHAKGICHRDIKPGNVMIDEHLHVKITDFGIAQMPGSDLTLHTELLGTPNYMAPEAFTSAKVDHRADIFSLGVLAYELFVGELPFSSSNLVDLERAICCERPLEPRKLVPEFPDELQRLLARMLKKKPLDRYQTAAGVVDEIDRIQHFAFSIAACAEAAPAPALSADWS